MDVVYLHNLQVRVTYLLRSYDCGESMLCDRKESIDDLGLMAIFDVVE